MAHVPAARGAEQLETTSSLVPAPSLASVRLPDWPAQRDRRILDSRAMLGLQVGPLQALGQYIGSFLVCKIPITICPAIR